METNWKYLLLLLGSISALIALFGPTWKTENKGIKRVTGWGVAAIILIAATLYVGYLNERVHERQAREAFERETELHSKITDLETRLEEQNVNLQVMTRLLDTVKAESVQNRKFNLAKTVMLDGRTEVNPKWNSVFGLFEILTSDCEVEIEMNFDLSRLPNVTNKLGSFGRLLPHGLVKLMDSFVESQQPKQSRSSVILKEADGTDFGQGSVVNLTLISNNLTSKDEFRFIHLFLLNSISFDLQPKGGGAQSCKVRYFSEGA